MKKRLLITPTGYFNTGSSAITHMLTEIEGVENSSGVYEMRILFDPDCISDLEYNLIENPHRQNTSFALQRFKRYIDFNSCPIYNHHYEKLCDGNFKKISYDYLDGISDFRYYGACHLDAYLKGGFFWIINRIYKKIVVSVFKYRYTSIIPVTLLKSQKQYAGTYSRDNFINATREYIGKLLSYLNKKDLDILMLDQLVPPTNVDRYLDYLPDSYTKKVIIVDRDPRDLYVTSKMFLTSGTIPIDTREHFVEWFKWTREQSKIQQDSDSILRVQFEDMIYEYERTRTKIVEFCGLGNLLCQKKKTIFKPDVSINNTQVWNRYPNIIADVEKIEKLLPEYCYDFESKKIKPDFINGKMFDC